MGKKKLLYTVGGNTNWCNHYGKQYGVASKKLKIKLPYHPTVSLMVYPKKPKSLICKDTHTPVSICVYIYTYIHTYIHMCNEILHNHKKWNASLCITLSGISQILCHLLYKESKKKKTSKCK